jgi:polyphosphate glucokinase
MSPRRRHVQTLAVDIGGTGIKASVLDEEGLMQAARVRVATPVGQPPSRAVGAIADLTRRLPRFDRISVGVPGVVAAGRVLTAPNLRHPAWLGFDLAAAMRARFGKPTRIANDVTLQGLAAIQGKGVELVVALGTGVGSALYLDGLLVPQFGLGQHHFGKGQTFDAELNNAAFERIGRRRWNRRLEKAIASLRRVVWYDRLYIGGGNARHIRFVLDARTTVISNEAGIRGGIVLWQARAA